MAGKMSGDQLSRLLDGRGWSNGDLAELLNVQLQRKYTAERIGQWRRGDRPVPADVSTLLEALAIETALPPDPRDAPGEPASHDAVIPTDDAPPPGPNDPQRSSEPQVPFPGGVSSSYERLCTELWEIIATGVGMVGAVLGSERLVTDGAIIDRDKVALGRAYGKLAQTNETFRNMLTGMTTSGAWLEVAVVTGSTVGKMWRNHATPSIVADERLHVILPDDARAAGA